MPNCTKGCSEHGNSFFPHPLPAILLLVTLLFTAACSSQSSKEIPLLRIGHAPHDHHAPLYIAAMNPDYFKHHGGIYLRQINFRSDYELVEGDRPLARVVINQSTGGEKLIRNLDENLNDLSFGGVPAMLSYIDRGSDFKILLPVMSEGGGLVVRKDLPVSNWQEFAALVRQEEKPFKIGYKTAVSVQNLIFETALQAEQIPFAQSNGDNTGVDIVLINLFGAKNLIPALENGIIDGFVVNQPFVAMAMHKGSGKLIAQLGDLPPAGKWKNNPCCALAGNNQYVSSQPQAVQALLTLLLRANSFIGQYPEQSAGQIAEWLGIEPEIERLSLPTISFNLEYTEDWNRGVDFWVESMVTAANLNSKVKVAYEQGMLRPTVYNMELYARARQKM